MNCPNCKTNNRDEATYCKACGQKLLKDDAPIAMDLPVGSDALMLHVCDLRDLEGLLCLLGTRIVSGDRQIERERRIRLKPNKVRVSPGVTGEVFLWVLLVFACIMSIDTLLTSDVDNDSMVKIAIWFISCFPMMAFPIYLLVRRHIALRHNRMEEERIERESRIIEEKLGQPWADRRDRLIHVYHGIEDVLFESYDLGIVSSRFRGFATIQELCDTLSQSLQVHGKKPYYLLSLKDTYVNQKQNNDSNPEDREASIILWLVLIESIFVGLSKDVDAQNDMIASDNQVIDTQVIPKLRPVFSSIHSRALGMKVEGGQALEQCIIPSYPDAHV